MAAVAAGLVLAVVGGTVGASLSQQHKSAAAVEKYGSNVLKLYLPGEYLGENVISDFEKQYGVRVIVKSNNPVHLAENCEIFSFTIENEDVQTLRKLNRGKRVFQDPDEYYI